jgi:hypothetical protein
VRFRNTQATLSYSTVQAGNYLALSKIYRRSTVSDEERAIPTQPFGDCADDVNIVRSIHLKAYLASGRWGGGYPTPYRFEDTALHNLGSKPVPVN